MKSEYTVIYEIIGEPESGFMYDILPTKLRLRKWLKKLSNSYKVVEIIKGHFIDKAGINSAKKRVKT